MINDLDPVALFAGVGVYHQGLMFPDDFGLVLLRWECQ